MIQNIDYQVKKLMSIFLGEKQGRGKTRFQIGFFLPLRVPPLFISIGQQGGTRGIVLIVSGKKII